MADAERGYAPSRASKVPSIQSGGSHTPGKETIYSERKPEFLVHCLDISSDGNEVQVLNEEFDESHLDRLQDLAPSMGVRLLIAQDSRYRTNSTLGHRTLEDCFFALSVHQGSHAPWQPPRDCNIHDFFPLLQFLSFQNTFLSYAFGTMWMRRETCMPPLVKVGFFWLKKSACTLVGLVLLPNSSRDSFELNPYAFRSIFQGYRSAYAAYHSDPPTEQLGRLVLLSVLDAVTSMWTTSLHVVAKSHPAALFRFDMDGLPICQDLVKPIRRHCDTVKLILRMLDVPFERDAFPSVPFTAPESKILELLYSLSFITEAAQNLKSETADFRTDLITRTNLRESRAVRHLAVFATIFLPLTLATGVLNMQNRLRDVHLMLWDFVAISADVGLFVYAGFWTVNRMPQITTSIHDLRDGDDYTRRRNIVRAVTVHGLQKVTTGPLLPLVVLVVLTSLNFGLFGPSDPDVAWKILGFGVGSLLVLILLQLSYFLFGGVWRAYRLG